MRTLFDMVSVIVERNVNGFISHKTTVVCHVGKVIWVADVSTLKMGSQQEKGLYKSLIITIIELTLK